MSDIKFDTLIMTIPNDYQRLKRHYDRIVGNISYGELYFVGNKEVEKLVREDGFDEQISAIDEDTILRFADVHNCVKERMKRLLDGRELPRGVTGWYYQQFLKMQYAMQCEDEYYMVWDGDTLPCKPLSMFQKETGRPYLDLKHEFHAEYFETLGRILPGFKKVIEGSFISEHMLIRTEIMRALIKEIESNTSIRGKYFWEKILNAIPEEKIQASAFSEFETYGTYVAMRYPAVYALREWHSFRLGGEFFDPDTISDRDFSWLSKDFDAISFEKGHSVREDHKNLFDNPYYQEKLTPKQMLQAAQLEFKEGYREIWSDDNSQSCTDISYGAFGEDEEKKMAERLKYLSADTWMVYEALGRELENKNIDQAFLCYENAAFLCPVSAKRRELEEKKETLKATGKVHVRKACFVILSYNNIYMMQKCLESIYINCNPESYSLVVLDNASTDGVAEWLKNQPDYGMTLLLSDENMGFASGCNEAAKHAPEGEDIFFLNNDTRVPPNALFWLRMGLYAATDIGAVGSMQNYGTVDQMEEATFELPEAYVKYGAERNVPMRYFWEEKCKLCGFAMMIKREVYDKIGGFDEQFSPGYLEDDDLSFQIKREGYRLGICHNSFIYHAGSQSFSERKDIAEVYERNRLKIERKWGFDLFLYSAMMPEELSLIESLEEKGYDREKEYQFLYYGAGCGNAISRLQYLYPNAKIVGIEENEKALEVSIKEIPIYGIEKMSEIREEDFDLVIRNNRKSEEQ
ncbi:MAG: glycosyltransferase [Lachnospiraceae bacterium]|nr:glycosyltransferase [Lachnospiraceae bacterium]